MSEELVVNELSDSDFDKEEDWNLIRPLELMMSSKPDDDDVYDVYYKLGNDDGRLCSEVRDEDMDDGEIQDIADIMFPIFHNTKHKRRVVSVEANFLVGYVGENIKSDDESLSIFAFPLFWNGTINVGDRGAYKLPAGRVESYEWKERWTSDKPDLVDLSNDITIDLTQPVGKYIMKVESGGEEWDIDDYELDDRQRIVQQSFTNDDYKLEFDKGKDVIKIIDKIFTKPEEISIKQGEVQIYTEEGKARLIRHRKKFNETFEAIKDRLKILQKKPVIRSNDLKQIKDMLPELTYDEIEDDINQYSTRDKQLKEGMKELFNIVLAKLRKQKETASIPPPVVEPIIEPVIPISKEQDLLNQLDKVKKLLGDAMIAYKQSTTIQNTRDVNKYKLQAIELAKLLKEEREREGGGIDNPKLYEKAKEIVYKQYPKHSAYRSGQLVKKYKEMGGTYSGKKDTDGLTRWFKEEWKDIGNKEYPVYRPTKRVTIETPLTPDEIKPSNLRSQIVLKQKIKGTENLPHFEPKVGGKVVALGVQAEKIPKQDEIWKWSNPDKVAEKAKKYLGDMAVVFRSTKPKKKYMIFDPVNNKWVFFGEINYEDFTKHQDPKRRENYLTRTASMKGNWKNNRYSANNLSRNILW